MKMAFWFSRHMRLLPLLMGLALLGACGSDSDEDLTVPTLTLDALGPSTLTSDRTLSGRIEEGAGLEIAVNTDANVGQISIEDGTWSCTISDLEVGSNVVTVNADDSRGNTSSLQFILVRHLLVIDQADTITSQTSSTVHGRLAEGATITSVTLNGEPVTPPESGETFSILLNVLDDGNYAVAITAGNAAGDTQTESFTIFKDSNAVFLTIDKPDPLPTGTSSLVLTGTVEDGATVAVSVAPDTASVGEDSDPEPTVWSFAVTGLEERDNIITVTASLEGRTASAWTRVVFAEQ